MGSVAGRRPENTARELQRVWQLIAETVLAKMLTDNLRAKHWAVRCWETSNGVKTNDGKFTVFINLIIQYLYSTSRYWFCSWVF
jgi:hypothetical protein